MRCHFCGRMDALIRGIELPVARFTLRAHVDCKGHSEYRAVSHLEVEESNKAFTLYLDHAPEMLDLIQNVARTWEDDCQFIPCDTEAAVELSSRLSRLAAQATKLLAKIEGGGE